jgi:xylulokinase
MYLIGYDIGSSSVKASLVEALTGRTLTSEFFPKQEMAIIAHQPGWAEQHPEDWWENLRMATASILASSRVDAGDIKAIGISYQMHGLVMVDKDQNILRPSIIWCDSRAVRYGEEAFGHLGKELCLSRLLNSPGNFTASKLKWAKENEPAIYGKTAKIMLPGDYIAMKMTGEITTTLSGLSEGMLWDFRENGVARFLLDHYGLDASLIPGRVPTFSVQGELSASAARELGLKKGTKISYRAGDQPNNAFSLNVLHPGEVAATAGTSGVVYGISDEVKYDPLSRVNTFAHVNHSEERNSLGVLLCINGTGILYSWLRKNTGNAGIDYGQLNSAANAVPVGSEGLTILPFGNGAERMLGNADTGCQVHHLNFNRHNYTHLLRAAQEGIAFAFCFGLNLMKETGINPVVIRAGNSNLLLSPVFRETLAGISGATIELYDTDGSQGAAKGAGIGAGIYRSIPEAFQGLQKVKVIEPDGSKREQYEMAYKRWIEHLDGLRGGMGLEG